MGEKTDIIEAYGEFPADLPVQELLSKRALPDAIIVAFVIGKGPNAVEEFLVPEVGFASGSLQ